MGEKEKGQGGGGGRQSRQAPQRIPERQSHPATTRASSPQGATVARSASAARVQSRGCKGRSPLHKKTKKIAPFPGGEERSASAGGGMGEKEKGQGGGGGRQSRQAPQRIPERHSHQATTRASSPQGATVARSAGAARVQPRGCKGFSPLHKKTKKSPPFPPGRGLGGRGQESIDTAGKADAAGHSAPRRATAAAG